MEFIFHYVNDTLQFLDKSNRTQLRYVFIIITLYPLQQIEFNEKIYMAEFVVPISYKLNSSEYQAQYELSQFSTGGPSYW